VSVSYIKLSTLKPKHPEFLSCTTTSTDAKCKIMVSSLGRIFRNLMHYSSLPQNEDLFGTALASLFFLSRSFSAPKGMRPPVISVGRAQLFLNFNLIIVIRPACTYIAAACYTPRALFVETINHYKCGARLLLAVRSFHSFLSRLDNTMRHVYCHCL
jgi:hypothetical protein